MATESGFTGFEEIDNIVRRLNELGRTVSESVEDKVLQAGAEVLRDKIKTHPNIPVSAQDKVHGKDNFLIKKITPGRYDVGVSEKNFYLLFHEIGAKGGTYRGTDGRDYTTPDIPAKPFMRPALENNKTLIEKEMAKVLKREMGL